MARVVSMENVEHPIFVLVRLDGREPTAKSAYLCLDVNMGHVNMPWNAFVMRVGLVPTVKFLIAMVVSTADVKVPTVAFAMMVGWEILVKYAQNCPDALMVTVVTILILVYAKKDMKDISVMYQSARILALMAFVLRAMGSKRTFAFVKLDGKMQHVPNVFLIGIVPTRVWMLVTCPMNASVQILKPPIQKDCATTTFSIIKG